MIVGGPVSHREWILPTWKTYVEEALEGLEYSFLFAVSASDHGVIEILEDWGAEYIKVAELNRVDKRNWEPRRIKYMVQLRNRLLTEVRYREPDYFFSLDSDILIHKDSVKSALSIFEDDPEVWAVGLKAFMTPKFRAYSSAAVYKNEDKREAREAGYRRPDVDEVIYPDAIMAAKIMDPRAYNIDYSFKTWGEDGGWSDNVMLAGGKLAHDGRIVNKHIMSPDLFETLVEFDERAGW